MTDSNTMQDPRECGPKPPFQKQDQSWPGSEANMTPKPDDGEVSYPGSGKLTSRIALVTGADSGIGRAIVLAFAREGTDITFAYLDESEDAMKQGVRVNAVAPCPVWTPLVISTWIRPTTKP